MSKLNIVTGENNPILRAKSEPVKKFDSTLKKLIKDMKETMAAAKGLGIAAPQVGENVQVFIVTLNHGSSKEVALAMVNPKITARSLETEIAEEGCLSLPGVWQNVERARAIKVEFYDVDGDKMIMDLEGMNARVVQHEKDHLEGVLFVDRVNAGLSISKDKLNI